MKKRRTLVAEEGQELRELAVIADHLNRFPRMTGSWGKAWRRAEYIVSFAVPAPWEPTRKTILSSWMFDHPSIAKAAQAFNEWAKMVPVHFIAQEGKDKQGAKYIHAGVDTKSDEGFALWFLWRFFVQAKNWQRLRRCPQCRKWFVDKTRNGVMERCSRSCTDKWWTLERRRAAGHKVPGSTRQVKQRRDAKKKDRITTKAKRRASR